MPRRALLALVTLSAALGGCRQQCTELGCIERGLVIELAPSIAARGVSRVAVAFDGTTQSCSSAVPTCRIDDRFPERVTLSWMKGDRAVRTEQRLVTYNEAFPNGEQCPGRCRVARLALD
jgi:hypothetical protein